VRSVKKLKNIVEELLEKNPDASHDISHVMRVYELAMKIAEGEDSVDTEILGAAVLLHDIGGYKEMRDPTGKTDHAIESAKMAKSILEKLDFNTKQIKHIQECIISHRYRTGNKPKTIEAKILFDADKLDSVGAIGLARGFCWVGKNNAEIYRKVDIEEYLKENMGGKINGRIHDKSKHNVWIEFNVRTKFLMDKLYTKTGKEICQERLSFTKKFFRRLEEEIRGEK
jgi:uncharacterized protein